MASKGTSLETVRKIGLALPGVEESTMYGAPALKLHGQLLACIATNTSAEPNTVVARVGFEQREELLKRDPQTFYLKPHYENYPAVLVRLSRIDPDGLRSVLELAWRFATTKKPARKHMVRKRAL